MNQTKTAPIEFLAMLRETSLALLHEADCQHQSVPVLLAKILEKATERVADVKPMMAVIGLLSYQPFAIPVISAALEAPLNSIRLPLSTLVQFSLIDRISMDRYHVVHRLVHTYAHEYLPTSKTFIKRLADYFSELATSLTQQRKEGYAQLDQDREHILAVLRVCLHGQNWLEVQRIVLAVDQYFDDQDRRTERITTNEAGLKAARALGNQHVELKLLTNLGSLYRFRDLLDKALETYQNAVLTARKLNDIHKESQLLDMVGDTYRKLEQWEQAVDYYHQSLTVSRTITKNYMDAKNSPPSEDLSATLKRAMEILEKWKSKQPESDKDGDSSLLQPSSNASDHRWFESALLASISRTYGQMGLWDKAFAYDQQNWELTSTFGDPRLNGHALLRRASTYENADKVEQAFDLYFKALDLFHQEFDKGGEGLCFGSLGNLHWKQGNITEAIQCYLNAVLSTHKGGLWIVEQDQWELLGVLYRINGQEKQALKCYHHCLKIVQRKGERSMEAVTLGKLGDYYSTIGQISEAIKYYTQALAILDDIQAPQADQVRKSLEIERKKAE